MQNPTSEHGLGALERRQVRPETPEYDELPLVKDVVIPVAGIEYAWVLPESVPEAQKEYDKHNLHYTQIPGVPMMFVAGIPVALMGRGRAIRGAPPEATTCPVFIDENAAVRIDKAREDKDLPPLYEAYYPPAKEPVSSKDQGPGAKKD